MENVLPSFLVGMREALHLWAALIAASIVSTALVMTTGWRLRERVLRRWVRKASARLRAERQLAGVRELRRRADEVAALAGYARAVAEDRRREWIIASGTTRAAWVAFKQMDAVIKRDLAAMAIPVPRPVRSRKAVADRRAWLNRAAMRALARGRLSHHQLVAVRAGRDGFDPRRHQADLEIRLHHATRDHLFEVYRDAAAAERAAARAAEEAAVTWAGFADSAGRAAAASVAARVGAAQPSPAPAAGATIVTRIPRPRAGGASGLGALLKEPVHRPKTAAAPMIGPAVVPPEPDRRHAFV